MEFVTVFFSLMSLFVISYILYSFKKNRVHILIEIFFLGIYFIVFLLFLFPDLLKIFEEVFRIDSGLNFIIYTSIFIAYFIVFLLYIKTEKQREDITKLNRELSFTRKELEKEKNKTLNKQTKKK